VGFLERLGERIASFVDDVALPDELRERVELAAALVERGDLDSAERELEGVVELRPEYARAWRLLGIVKWKRLDGDGAVDALERAGDPESLVALAEVHRARGQMDAAADARIKCSRASGNWKQHRRKSEAVVRISEQSMFARFAADSHPLRSQLGDPA